MPNLWKTILINPFMKFTPRLRQTTILDSKNKLTNLEIPKRSISYL